MHWRTLSFVGGISLGIYAGYESVYASELALLALLLFVIQGGMYMFERKKKSIGLLLSLYTTLVCFGLVVGIVRVQVVEEKVPYVCEVSCTFDARVVSSPEIKDAHQTLVVHPLEEGRNVYDIQLRVPLYPSFTSGEIVRVSGTPRLPEYLPPHGEDKSFDYASYLRTRNVGSDMLFPTVEVLNSEAYELPSVLARWKEDLVRRIDLYVSSPASALASGMLFGNSSMSRELIDTFRVAGLSHIVVLSGFNIAIVISSILFVFAFVPLILRITLASIFVIAFVTMVGGEAGVARATAMAFIALLSTLVGRAYVARQALLLSLFAIIMYEPNALLHDVSLHLSFLATAGIVYLSDPIKKILSRYNFRTTFVELFTTTIAAYIATLPYVMHTFGTVSVYALIANIIVLPCVPIAMLLSFLVVVMSYIGAPLALLFGYVDSLVLQIVLYVAYAIEGLPFSSLTLTLSFTSMCVIYVTLAVWACYLARKGNDETSHTTNDGYITGIVKY